MFSLLSATTQIMVALLPLTLASLAWHDKHCPPPMLTGCSSSRPRLPRIHDPQKMIRQHDDFDCLLRVRQVYMT
jgi:hypothetical protein